MNTGEFKPWGKIPREHGELIVITEKLDGTNACIIIEDGKITGVQSRNRLIMPNLTHGKGADNYGFAQWVKENYQELLGLGEGYHYGEWVGEGIQKNPHKLEGRKFFLFNTLRWNEQNTSLPNCCDVVPILYTGAYHPNIQKVTMTLLEEEGSELGGKPEGIITYYCKTKRFTKDTFAYRNGKHGTA